jgi:Cu/Ag efflux pump CusA
VICCVRLLAIRNANRRQLLLRLQFRALAAAARRVASATTGGPLLAPAPLRQVLLEAGAIRFKPILLTTLAAMIGASVILFDPIFQVLAISLLFGLASSSLLMVLMILSICVILRDNGRSVTPPIDEIPVS